MTKLGWDFGQKAVGTYMTEIFRERMVQRESELRAVTNAAKRFASAARRCRPNAAASGEEAASGDDAASGHHVAAAAGRKAEVPANLRTTMPFGPAGLQIPRQTRSAAPQGNPGASGAKSWRFPHR